jgi:hypothetical protein
MTLGGTYLCAVCHKAFVTIGRKNGHIHETHAEAAQIFSKLEKGTHILHLPRVQASMSPSRVYSEALASV